MVFNSEIEQLISKLTLMDDPFMTTFFKDNVPATELILQIIMERSDLKVTSVRVQETLKNLWGHSLRLDILASDSSGKQYNIEFQNDNSGASFRRARYHSSLLDAGALPAGESFSALPETFVIFITRNDVLGGGLPIYHIDRVIRENGAAFEDGAKIIYVNGSICDSSPLGKLMQDFNSKVPEEMNYDILKNQMHFFKQEEEGRKRMCAAFEEYAGKREIKALEKGMVQGQKKMIITMLKSGIATPEQMALATEYSLDEIKQMVAS